jgi:ribosome recycling factor
VHRKIFDTPFDESSFGWVSSTILNNNLGLQRKRFLEEVKVNAMLLLG